jgi:hypothetical protein
MNLNTVCFTGIILVMLVVIVYVIVTKSKKKSLIKSLKDASPVPGRPVLIRGPAVGPKVRLPSTGETCAFYAIHVFSRTLTVTGKAGSEAAVGGFFFLDTSGSFDVMSDKDGKAYRVGITEMCQNMSPPLDALALAAEPFFHAAYGSGPQTDELFKLLAQSNAIMSMLRISFGMGEYIERSRSGVSVNVAGYKLYDKVKQQFKVGTAVSTIDVSISDYTFGRDVPSGVMKILTDKKILDSHLVKDGDDICIIEFFIPIGKPVYVVGTLSNEGEKNMIIEKDPVATLTISYEDPETCKLI